MWWYTIFRKAKPIIIIIIIIVVVIIVMMNTVPMPRSPIAISYPRPPARLRLDNSLIEL